MKNYFYYFMDILSETEICFYVLKSWHFRATKESNPVAFKLGLAHARVCQD